MIFGIIAGIIFVFICLHSVHTYTRRTRTLVQRYLYVIDDLKRVTDRNGDRIIRLEANTAEKLKKEKA